MAGKSGHGNEGAGSTGADAARASQTSTACEENTWDWTLISMEQVVCKANMHHAYARVVRNKGAAGVDGMSVGELKAHLQTHWPTLRAQLLSGDYVPQAVRAVDIPKPGGGVRTLGIPTVVDRLIQQAVLQVLQRPFDVTFSNGSFGFRPGRSAQQAVKRAHGYIASGYRWVVDLDLEKFFDRVNHDLLMGRLAKRIQDKRILKLIRRYLQAGLMSGGVATPRAQGTPQGGPLSPLLSNILLDELDKELERRGHCFVRYADDCNVYVRSQLAGERVLNSLERFLQQRLKLVVNRSKSAVAQPWERSFLGYTVTKQPSPRLQLATMSIKRLKAKIRTLFRMGRGRSLVRTISELKPMLRGWLAYFRLTEARNRLQALDSWLRRKLRCIVWRQWKRPSTRMKRLTAAGVYRIRAKRSAYNKRGPWWNAGSQNMNIAVPSRTLHGMGLISLVNEHQRLACLT